MIKQARPKWMKMMAGGKLSPAGIQALQRFFPKSVTRQLERTLPKSTTNPVNRNSFGGGMEGETMPTWTGQLGPTALKLFYDSPALTKNLRTFTKGTKVNYGLGNASLLDRFVLMSRGGADSPFAKIHQLHPRGWVMERLRDLPDEFGREAQRLPAAIRMLRSARSENWDQKDVLAATAYVQDAFRRRHQLRPPEIKDLQRRLRPFMAPTDRRRYLSIDRELSDAGLADIRLPLGKRNYRATDVGLPSFNKPKNMMLNSEGRIVLSDPLFNSIS